MNIKEMVSSEDLVSLQQLEKQIWDMDPIPIHQTLTAVKNGGIALGAHLDGRLVGFLYSFPGFKDGQTYLCSHMMGIHPEYRSEGIGQKLKEEQRKLASLKGYSLITWTFDPLESVNAYLNLHKLHGIGAHYIVNQYGSMNDAFNYGLPTDRFLIEWWIQSDHVNQGGLYNYTFDENDVLLTTFVNQDGFSQIQSDQSFLLLSYIKEVDKAWYVPIPSNYQQIKKNDMELAIDWRMKTRSIFALLMERDYVAVDVLRFPDHDTHYYVFAKNNNVLKQSQRGENL
ncbi:MAG: GNAT family N-acetyltransferase [Bacilli bacterium]